MNFADLFESEEVKAEDLEVFKIDNDNTAEWAVSQIKDAQDEHDRLTALIDTRIEELKAEREKLDSRLESSTAFLTNALREYASSVKMKETKTQKSYKLLSGSLVFKKGTKKITHNDELLVDRIDEEFVKVTKKVDWANYKKRLIVVDSDVVDVETGEVIEGCGIEDVPESFSVKL